MNSIPAKNEFAFSGEIGGKIAENIWDSIKSGLILVDSEGKILLWNNWIAMRNLAAAEAHAPRLKAMRAMVDDWIRETGDRGAVMEDPVRIYESYFGNKAK